MDRNGEHGLRSDERSLADLVSRISENASLLVREEIELAKAEMDRKLKRIARGAAIAGAAGFFVLLGMIFLLDSAAWGINSLFDFGGIWPGFAIVAALLFGLAAAGGLIAARSLKAGTPPTPDQAIEEARLIREALEHPEVQEAMAATGEGAREE